MWSGDVVEGLPRREREVFEGLCRLETGTGAAVRSGLADPLSDSAVRTLLTRLEAKGLVRRRRGADGFVYAPASNPETVAAGALKRMVDTFFAGSAASAATALLGLAGRLAPGEAAALARALAGGGEREP